MYCMNNVVIVDHHGLLIYVDLSYPNLFHDVSYLHISEMHGTWPEHFAYNNMHQYFEYVLGDSGYVGT